jgi:signal transduction histidine kinase
LLEDFTLSSAEHRHKASVTHNDQIVWLSLHKSHQYSDNTGHENQTLVLEDITDMQLLEQELIHSERLASIGRLAAGVAHEIGNPLTGIACLAQNMQLEPLTSEAKDSANDIITQTERISSIVQSLVNFSHGGTHNPSSRFQTINLRDCAEEAVKLVLLDRDAREVDIKLRVDEVELEGDYQQLLQVMVNLLINARDASSAGGQITLASKSHANSVYFYVSDQGHGIPPAQLDRIFEPFFTTKPSGEGTGLGLALVYSIINNHQGSIRADSPDPDTGRCTRFIIQLNYRQNN